MTLPRVFDGGDAHHSRACNSLPTSATPCLPLLHHATPCHTLSESPQTGLQCMHQLLPPRLPFTFHHHRGPLLLTTYYLLLTVDYLIPSTHHSLLTTHYSRLITHYTPLTTHYWLLATLPPRWQAMVRLANLVGMPTDLEVAETGAGDSYSYLRRGGAYYA